MDSGNKNFIQAGFFTRLSAYIIDIVIINFSTLFIRMFISIIKLIIPNFIIFKDILFNYSLFDIALYSLGAVYFILMVYFTGATLGKKVMNIKVVNKAGEKLEFLDILYRETIGRYLSSILFIGYIMIAITKNKQALHDKLCNTQVIYNYTQFNLSNNLEDNLEKE